MSRANFRPVIGANDTSSFINVAALQQEGRNATADRQLESERLRSEIVSRTNDQRLASNQQDIELIALELQNEQALRALAERMQGTRASMLTARRSDDTARRGQDINKTIASDELGFRREALTSGNEQSALDRAARADLAEADIASRAREGDLTRANQLDVVDRSQDGQLDRQQLELSAASERQDKELVARASLARQGHEAARDSVLLEIESRKDADLFGFFANKNLIELQHELELERLNTLRETEPLAEQDVAVLGNITQNLDKMTAETFITTGDTLTPEGRQKMQRLADLAFIHQLERQGGRISADESEELSDWLLVVSPEIAQEFENLSLSSENPVNLGRTLVSNILAIPSGGEIPFGLERDRILLNEKELKTFLSNTRQRVLQ